MPFCVNCGNKLPEGAKFCNSCGSKVNSLNTGKRENVFDGKIHKCPRCGETLNSFTPKCPTCSHELRTVDATGSIIKFYEDLNNTTSIEQKDYLIRNFPIPNTKEDIIEFMILASSNLFGEDNKNIFEAWIAKFDQCYQKALLLFRNGSDFAVIQQIYNDCQEKIDIEKERKFNKITFDTLLRNIAVCVGVVMLIIAIWIDNFHGNASLIELISYIVLIVSVSSLAKRGAILLDYVVAAGSGLLVIGSSFIFNNGSMAQLCGGIILIIVAVNYFKSIKSNKKE